MGAWMERGAAPAPLIGIQSIQSPYDSEKVKEGGSIFSLTP
jgi:hypothetical protein